MLHLPEVIFRKIRNFFSRSRWLIRLLHLSAATEQKQQPGLILIQIDALSHQQIEAALQNGRMPFLKSLLDSQHYSLHRHYSGMPCCTPAVQGELFYGVPGSVPSFSFYRKSEKCVFTLFNPPDAESIESELKQKGRGLFEGGSCYSNIFTGGADEAHFCISDLRLGRVFTCGRTFSFIIAVVLHLFSLIRAGALLVLEFFLAIIDCFRGLISGRDLGKELKFIPSRVGLCILLREIIVIGAKLDITRGLPIIQLNLMGYHEQSHRRGATSRFAHWTLKGIDDAIHRIWKKAHQVDKQYEVWIYSDHGQVDTYPYRFYAEQSIQDTIIAALKSHSATVDVRDPQRRPGFLHRLGWRFQQWSRPHQRSGKGTDLLVTTLGPLAHVYLPAQRENLRSCAAKLISTGKIPMVLIREGTDAVRVLTCEGNYVLGKQGDAFRFNNDFVPDEWIDDFVQACHHPNAGDLIISGYQGTGEPYLTFAVENGSHGGVTENEYSGFFMGPKHCPVQTDKGYVRPLDIRNGAMGLLGRAEKPITTSITQCRSSAQRFRIMTYNVHSCEGMDGQLSVLRIARVIGQFNPDIVALQELDVGRMRSGHEDQAGAIAERLEMDHFFFPAITLEEERYGDAILSRFPMRLIQSDILPGHRGTPRHERRGALWVEIDINGQLIHCVNTHLGLTPWEPQLQIDSLLGHDWRGHESIPTILCGDFNFRAGSKLYRRCCGDFKSAVPQSGLKATYCGHRPLVRLDHIFYSGLQLYTCEVGDTALARLASDHRPVIAEFISDGISWS